MGIFTNSAVTFSKNRHPSYSLKGHRDLVDLHIRASAPVVYPRIDAVTGSENSDQPHHPLKRRGCSVVFSDRSLDSK